MAAKCSRYAHLRVLQKRLPANHGFKLIMILQRNSAHRVSSPGRGARGMKRNLSVNKYNGCFYCALNSGWIYPRHWGRKQYKAYLSHEYLTSVDIEIEPDTGLLYTRRYAT